MFTTFSCRLRWLAGLPPKDTSHALAHGEPPLPGMDRYGRPTPGARLAQFQQHFRRFLHKVDQWTRHGCPILPSYTMNTRSPHFVILVLALFALGMILPEVLGLTYS